MRLKISDNTKEQIKALNIAADKVYGWSKAGISNGADGFEEYVRETYLDLAPAHIVGLRVDGGFKVSSRGGSFPNGEQKYVKRNGDMQMAVKAYSPRTKKYAGTKIGLYGRNNHSLNYYYRGIPGTPHYKGIDRDFMRPASKTFRLRKKALAGMTEMIDNGLSKLAREMNNESIR